MPFPSLTPRRFGAWPIPQEQAARDPWRHVLAALGLCCLLLCGAPILGQQTSSTPAESEAAAEDDDTHEATFLDEVTVTAAHVPTSLRDTPGQVSIVTDEDIADHLLEDIADLVKYEPGVYVEGDSTRLGLNGFNIRGIGGNRVLTQIDGVRGAEQFDFGPFNVHQQSIDIDTLKSAEIVRSAGSALYGSDAVGGVISLITKNPSDYLGGGTRHFGAKAGFDGRGSDSNLNMAVAGGGESGRASLFVSSSRGNELDNAGQTGGNGTDRDLPNPQEREQLQGSRQGRLRRLHREHASSHLRTERRRGRLRRRSCRPSARPVSVRSRSRTSGFSSRRRHPEPEPAVAHGNSHSPTGGVSISGRLENQHANGGHGATHRRTPHGRGLWTSGHHEPERRSDLRAGDPRRRGHRTCGNRQRQVIQPHVPLRRRHGRG